VRSPACSIAGVTASTDPPAGGEDLSNWDYKKAITITYSPTRYGGIFDGSTLSNTQTITKRYYYAGATRVAMRDDGTLYFLLSDHLGSTSLTIEDDESTGYVEMGYSHWGSVRYTFQTMLTDFTYTGQRSQVDDFGLM